MSANPLTDLKLTFHSDGGHGWLAVSTEALKLLSVETLLKVSACSYLTPDFGYFEEDCDAALISSALEREGYTLRVSHVNDGSYSPIRQRGRWSLERLIATERTIQKIDAETKSRIVFK